MSAATAMSFVGAFLFIYLILLLFVIIVSIFMIVVRCMLINKAEPGAWWKGIIPIYNRWAVYDISFNRKTTILVFILDLVFTFGTTGINIVSRGVTNIANLSTNNNVSAVDGTLLAVTGLFSIIGCVIGLVALVLKGYAHYALAHAFGRETGFCVLAIFFPLIMMAIMAFNPNIEYTEDKLELLQD